MKKETLQEGLLVSAIGGILVIVAAFLVYISRTPSQLPTVCVSLPKEVALWGVNVHDTGAGLYLCFQQGVENDRTETRCVPMTKEKCSK